MRIFIVLNFVLPLLAYRCESNCFELPKSNHISSICPTDLGSDSLQLKVHLTHPANVGKTELQCEDGDTEGSDNTNLLTCKLIFNITLEGSASEDARFDLYRKQMKNLYPNRVTPSTERYRYGEFAFLNCKYGRVFIRK
nr:hypothetical protein [Hymenolepis microstoma]